MGLLPKKIIIGIITISVFSVSVYVIQYTKTNYRTELLESPVIHRMIPMYRSIRKLPDLIFMPWSAFAKSNLEKYELTINPKNIGRMNAVLPKLPFGTGMDIDSKLWVSGYFRTSDYKGKVKVRYRGNMSSQWNAYQKSYLIKFPKDNLFNGMRELNLVIPSKRRYLAMSLNNYRAEKLGLIYSKEKLVTLEVNGADTGVLFAFERWSQPWIEKMPISSLSTIYGAAEGSSTYQNSWKSWNMDDPIDKNPLLALQEIVEYADDQTFTKMITQLVDVDAWLSWDIMRILATGYHVTPNTSFGANNLVLIFDRSEGRFKPVPYNTVIYTPSFRKMVNDDGQISRPTRLYQRILSIPEFRTKRDNLFTNYVKNEKENDMLFIKNWEQKFNREFLMDTSKNANNFMYLSKIKEIRISAENYFSDPFNMLARIYTPEISIKEQLNLPTDFTDLYDTLRTPDEMIKKYTFLQLRSNELYIPPGNHYINETLIIPKNMPITIAPGAILNMGENVSIVSYSPVIAEGNVYNPIKFKPQDTKKGWGVFAIINTESATSTLSFLTLEQGGEDTINGAYISGTLALHNSNSVIKNTTVSKARGGDGINIKGSYVKMTNTTLSNNSSDGLDLDYIQPNSIIEGNIFTDNAGDAIDVSWSNIRISNNTITNCVDKGISVGEKSSVVISNNTITNCSIGIAVKDSSKAVITENILENNITAFSLYQKKPYFKGGNATATNNTLLDNKIFTYTDDTSTIFTNENTIQRQ